VGAVSLTWEKKYREPFLPLLDVTHVPYNNLSALEGALDGALDEGVAAVVVEIVQGEGGVNLGTAEFLQGAQRLCQERGSLLVIDEIQTGFGRTGKWFGLEHFGLEPDIICLAKGLGAGFPMGALAYGERVQAALYAGAHGSTFGGNPLACAAGLAAITAYQDEHIVERAAQMGDLLLQKLRGALAETPVVREVRGLGMMVGIDLRQKPGPYLKRLMDDHGVLALPAGSSVLRLLPPLIAGEAEIDEAVAAVAQVLAS